MMPTWSRSGVPFVISYSISSSGTNFVTVSSKGAATRSSGACATPRRCAPSPVCERSTLAPNNSQVLVLAEVPEHPPDGGGEVMLDGDPVRAHGPSMSNDPRAPRPCAIIASVVDSAATVRGLALLFLLGLSAPAALAAPPPRRLFVVGDSLARDEQPLSPSRLRRWSIEESFSFAPPRERTAHDLRVRAQRTPRSHR